VIRQAFGKENLNCTLGSGLIEKGETGEEQSQEHAHHLL
jgi:hypothetical protein